MTLCHASGHPVTSRVIGVTISITPVNSDDHIILGFVISEALAASQNGKEQLETSSHHGTNAIMDAERVQVIPYGLYGSGPPSTSHYTLHYSLSLAGLTRGDFRTSLVQRNLGFRGE